MITGALETELVFVFQAPCLLSDKKIREWVPLCPHATDRGSAGPVAFADFPAFLHLYFPPQTVPPGLLVSQNHLAPRIDSNPLTAVFVEQSLVV